MLITYYDAYNVLTSVYSKGAYLKQALSDTPIRESTRPHLNKICYGVLDKDIYLSYLLDKLCAKSPKLAIKVILKIGLYSLIYLKTAPYAVTDTCVELAKKLGKGGTAGFINAVLRNYIRKGVEINETGNKLLSIKYSYPEFLIDKLVKNYGLELTENIISYDEENTFVRFNTGIDGEKYLIDNGVNYEKTPYTDTFIVKNFKMNEDFYSGVYTFQSIGSVAICDLVESGETLLDACSAPGGKAVNLSSKFNKVIACELHSHRAELIKSYASRMGKDNIEVLNLDSTVYNNDFEKAFSSILCDAPCSGTGVIKDNPDIKLNRTDSSIVELNETQLKLLTNLSKYVKVGGSLYYSTCSILNDENDGLVEKFLNENKDFTFEMVEPKLNYHKGKYGVTFLPHISYAGFYFCKLKRIK